MSPFGERLRQARETKGLSLETIADATRISRRHLTALERGDLDALPAGPFAKGYIRAYAEHLGIDPQPILESYRSEERRRGQGGVDARDKVIEEMSHIVAQRSGTTGRSRIRPGRKGVVAALAAAIALGAVGWRLSRGPDPRAADGARPSTPAPAAPGGEVVPGGGAPVASHPARETAGSGAAPTAPAPRSVPSGPASPAAPSPTRPDNSSRPVPSEPRPPSNLVVSDSGVGTEVRDRRLVGKADRFTRGSPVAFWTRVVGGRPGDAIRHVWFHEGQAVMRADLEIGGPQWRTYSRLDLPDRAIGSWAVEARAPDGRLLARQEFQCVREVP